MRQRVHFAVRTTCEKTKNGTIMKYFWTSAICVILARVYRSEAANMTFPANFVIGAATASYQIEGGWNASDKGENIWDHHTHYRPELVVDGSNGDIACDSYNKWEEDVQWVKDLGMDFYRFSLSWARILPTGFADQVSQDGLQYYKNLTEALIANNITPIVTIYHWDHPKILEDMGGWTNELMVDWYADYARIVFEELGPLVKTFITINEPNIFCVGGYNYTGYAPAKDLENMGHYLCVHNTLKAHATAYHIYDEEFRADQQGEIGILASCAGWIEDDNTTAAVIKQFFDFECGWVMHPIYVGDYPEIMKTRIAEISALEGWPFSRLPAFSEEWVALINGSADFFGLNHYTSRIISFDPDEEQGIYNIDSGIVSAVDESWAISNAQWIYVVPEGFGNVLRMIRDQYGNPPLYVLENGYPDTGELEDYDRIDYFYQYMSEMLTAIYDDGCNIVGYTVWSLLDNFEWGEGYTQYFGIISVDFESDNRTRTAKLSTTWWQEVLRTRELQPVPTANSTR